MKIIYLTAVITLLFSCSGSGSSAEERMKDSVENAELRQVDQILKNEDSLMKAKEKELLEKYGN